MILSLYVLQNQWIVSTLLAATALMLVFCLTYSAMWRPRGVEQKSEAVKGKGVRGFLEAVVSVIPWVLILIFLAAASYTVVSLFLRSSVPPNW